jgi:CHAD domain-containing protein
MRLNNVMASFMNELERRTREASQAARRSPADPGLPSVLTLPRARPGKPAGRAVRWALEAALSRIHSVQDDATAGGSEGIHRLRTATRRLRSELRAFDDWIDPQWSDPFLAELKWVAGLLGQVRDPDVLCARLTKAASESQTIDVQALAPLLEELRARQTRAVQELQAALGSERYHNLLAGIRQAVEHPPLRNEERGSCRKELPPLAADAWDRLKKGARALHMSDPDSEFHEVRKTAKRARYTAELIAQVLGHEAGRGIRRFIRLSNKVQDVLGEHQDAVGASRELTRSLAEHPDNRAFAVAAQRLLDSQADAAQQARSEFFEVWNQLDRKKSVRWLKT